LFLEHLVSASAADYTPELNQASDFDPLENLTPAQTLNSQKKTSDWLAQFNDDDEDTLTEAQEEKTVSAFNALIRSDPNAKNRLLQLDLPEEIKAAVGMVTAYQWKFVEQAEELRSMAVSHIVKEIQHPDARIRLKALEMLGKVTEVALFTDRVAIKSEDVTDEELDARIKEKLGRYMGAVDVVDVEELPEKDE
jgi:DNA-binding TFAR19-related protein (PDSD5 family)